ncbi:cofilin [Schistosoma bovis]|uniref:Cofilin n=1 Tax=Schistosoma bovis TaxID=6184 RepID=A0A430Q1D0_SCHBO|nr:cofilin [Schistosoma bovis]
MLKKHRYVMFHIDERGDVRILKEAVRAATYEDFRNDMVEAMKLRDGRYVIYDYEYPNKTTDLFFIMWTPRNLTLSKNMVYASTMGSVKSQFQGIKHTLQAHDLEDISEERFIEVGKQNRLC